MAIQLPTVISTSVISNAIIRGAERAVREFGSDYFLLVRKDIIRPKLRVYHVSSRDSGDLLATDQEVALTEDPIWSFDLEPLDSKEYSDLFGKNWLRYFFLSEEEALGFIDSLESKVMAHLNTKRAKNNG